MPVKPIPDGYHTLTPYLSIKGAAAAIEFYKKAFNAVELMRLVGPNGTIGHAEIRIGNSPIMLADEHPPMNFLSPKTIGGSPVLLHLYVDDSDKMFAQAVAAGATVLRALNTQFYGDRSGTILDPYGHMWSLSTHVEDVSAEEIERRAAAMTKEAA